MKKKIISLFILHFAFCILHSNAQTLSPKVSPACGGYFTGGGKTLSWTSGEPFYKTLQNGNNMLTQGFQQPYILVKILNLKAFIEGFYLGGGLMQPVLYNSYPDLFESNACDSITVELHDVNFPDLVVASSRGLLLTDGSAVLRFPSSLANGSYYLAIHHRNALETWSKDPVVFNSSLINYDFTIP